MQGIGVYLCGLGGTGRGGPAEVAKTPLEGVMDTSPRAVPDPLVVTFDLRHFLPVVAITLAIVVVELVAPKRGYPTPSYVVWDTTKHPIIGPVFVGLWSGLTWHLFFTDGREKARHLAHPSVERRLRAL